MGNFREIVNLISEYDLNLKEFIEQNLYLSSKIQNELISIVASYIRDRIKEDLLQNKSICKIISILNVKFC